MTDDDDALEPDLHGWTPSSLGDWEGFSPLNPAQYNPILKPIDTPPYVSPGDHTSDVPRWTPGAGPPMDDLTKLTLQQKLDLLNRNNIYLSTKQVSSTNQTGLGAMDAYVVSNDGLKPASSFTPILRFTKLKLRTPTIGLDQNTAYSYNEFDSHLQQQLATATTVEFGIPKVFKVNTGFDYSSSSATHSRDITVHFSGNNWVAGAEVVFDERDISLEPSFTEAVRNILNSNKHPENKGELLLAHLADHGEFVPLVRVLGGRMSLTENKTLSDSSTFKATAMEFRIAADARFKINNVPGQAGGGNGDGYWTTDAKTVIDQARSLRMRCVGGNYTLANGNPTHLGGQWIDSVSAHRLWRTIGFEENTLVPVINFLPDDLSVKALTLLRTYFYIRLHAQNTNPAGHKPTINDKSFDEKQIKGADGKPLAYKLEKFSRGPSQIVVRSEGNVDSIKLSYRVYDGGYSTGPSGERRWNTFVATGPYYGNDRTSPEETINLSPGEEIRKLEVWIDPNTDGGVMRSLAITTSKGIRSHESPHFF
jgi:hypothetical protein